MEAFSLLKYWRGGGGGGGSAVSLPAGDPDSTLRSTTILTSVTNDPAETDDDDDDAGDDDGPFFDLEFAVPDEEEEEESEGTKKEAENEEENDAVTSSSDDEEDEDDGEFKFTLSSGSSNDRADHSLTLSPSDDLFFKGRLVPIEPSSLVFSGSEPNSKPQFSLLKSATKFRVFMLRFKKPRPDPNASGSKEGKDEATVGSTTAPAKQQSGKLFTVKFKVEEVPMLSLFTRENSKSTKTTSPPPPPSQKQSGNNEDSVSVSVMNKYLKKVKPLYIRVSKRYGEKLKFSGQLREHSQTPTPAVPTAEKGEVESGGEGAAVAKGGQKQGNIPAGLRVVCKHLGKSRSASSAAVAAAPPGGGAVVSRRDDSLLQQQDGIQSAILHCKRSFNASRDIESSLLSRSVSDPSREKLMEFSGKKQGKGKSLGVTEENPKKAGNGV